MARFPPSRLPAKPPGASGAQPSTPSRPGESDESGDDRSDQGAAATSEAPPSKRPSLMDIYQPASQASVTSSNASARKFGKLAAPAWMKSTSSTGSHGSSGSEGQKAPSGRKWGKAVAFPSASDSEKENDSAPLPHKLPQRSSWMNPKPSSEQESSPKQIEEFVTPTDDAESTPPPESKPAAAAGGQPTISLGAIRRGSSSLKKVETSEDDTPPKKPPPPGAKGLPMSLDALGTTQSSLRKVDPKVTEPADEEGPKQPPWAKKGPVPTPAPAPTPAPKGLSKWLQKQSEKQPLEIMDAPSSGSSDKTPQKHNVSFSNKDTVKEIPREPAPAPLLAPAALPADYNEEEYEEFEMTEDGEIIEEEIMDASAEEIIEEEIMDASAEEIEYVDEESYTVEEVVDDDGVVAPAPVPITQQGTSTGPGEDSFVEVTEESGEDDVVLTAAPAPVPAPTPAPAPVPQPGSFTTRNKPNRASAISKYQDPNLAGSLQGWLTAFEGGGDTTTAKVTPNRGAESPYPFEIYDLKMKDREAQASQPIPIPVQGPLSAQAMALAPSPALVPGSASERPPAPATPTEDSSTQQAQNIAPGEADLDTRVLQPQSLAQATGDGKQDEFEYEEVVYDEETLTDQDMVTLEEVITDDQMAVIKEANEENAKFQQQVVSFDSQGATAPHEDLADVEEEEVYDEGALTSESIAAVAPHVEPGHKDAEGALTLAAVKETEGKEEEDDIEAGRPKKKQDSPDEDMKKEEDDEEKDNAGRDLVITLILSILLVIGILAILMATGTIPNPFSGDDKKAEIVFVGEMPTTPMEPFDPSNPADPSVPGACDFSSQIQPHVIEQCLCFNKVTSLTQDARDKYDALISEFLVPGIYSNWTEPVESCEPVNQALVWLSTGSATNATDLLQRYTLSLLYFSTNGPQWDTQTGWLTDADLCTWYGLFCGVNATMKSIELENNSLLGLMPAELGLLSGLETLSFSENFLSGTLPNAILGLPELRMASFASNRLYGTLPAELARATMLEVLELNDNQLDGMLATELGQATELKELNLARNTFQGEVPAEFSSLTNLILLDLESNMGITGYIPKDFGMFTDLRYLSVSSTNLGARFPTEYAALTNLEDLRIANTQVGGDIPGMIGELTQLTHLDLSASNFRQALPAEFFELFQLEYVALNGNSFEGKISPEFGNLTEIHTLLLDGNQFSGTIPSQLARMTGLERLTLEDNLLTGRAPAELCSLRKMVLEELTTDCPTRTMGVVCPVATCCTSCRAIPLPDDQRV